MGGHSGGTFCWADQPFFASAYLLRANSGLKKKAQLKHQPGFYSCNGGAGGI
jgi:hypothetical protein